MNHNGPWRDGTHLVITGTNGGGIAVTLPSRRNGDASVLKILIYIIEDMTCLELLPKVIKRYHQIIDLCRLLARDSFQQDAPFHRMLNVASFIPIVCFADFKNYPPFAIEIIE